MKLHTSQTIRLAGIYLAVMMAVSVIFSLILYTVLVNNIKKPFPEPKNQPNEIEYVARNDFYQKFAERNRQIKEEAILSIVSLNIAVLACASVFSYLLARMTLGPIEKMLEKQEKFISDASHELKTPLTALLSVNEVALRKKVLTEEKSRSVLKDNIQEIQKMQQLSQSLLDLSGSQTAKKEKRTDVLLSDFLSHSLKSLDILAAEKNIKVEKSSNVESAKIPQNTMRQVVVILVDNAIKYSSQGKEIKVNVDEDKNNLIFSVKDQGVGIDKKDINNIFDRFYRVDSARTRTRETGHGIGLSIAKSLVNANGGKIEVSSQLDEGTEFIVSLNK